MQVYDLGINNFKTFNKDYIKRINIPCEMTGIEIIDEMWYSKILFVCKTVTYVFVVWFIFCLFFIVGH